MPIPSHPIVHETCCWWSCCCFVERVMHTIAAAPRIGARASNNRRQTRGCWSASQASTQLANVSEVLCTSSSLSLVLASRRVGAVDAGFYLVGNGMHAKRQLGVWRGVIGGGCGDSSEGFCGSCGSWGRERGRKAKEANGECRRNGGSEVCEGELGAMGKGAFLCKRAGRGAPLR
ncbi:hypothetical protein BU16DRAFT_183215 [Lophium mytilinum]|uniref:Uncharacterized protein n=1 Tax=Lophium mytilinum TaxID=390894 RepID=A0A6A6QBR7_9PEZI|nr:hypothetical protein BU16DRAFT_183215 [Lophium mytilinum]